MTAMFVKIKPKSTKVVGGIRLTNPGSQDVTLVIEPAKHIKVEDEETVKCFDTPVAED